MRIHLDLGAEIHRGGKLVATLPANHGVVEIIPRVDRAPLASIAIVIDGEVVAGYFMTLDTKECIGWLNAGHS